MTRTGLGGQWRHLRRRSRIGGLGAGGCCWTQEAAMGVGPEGAVATVVQNRAPLSSQHDKGVLSSRKALDAASLLVTSPYGGQIC